MSDGTRSEAAFANHEDDGNDAKQDHRAEAIKERVMQSDNTMIAAHKNCRGDDLEPGRDTTASQLFHKKATHRQFFAEGKEKPDEHHSGRSQFSVRKLCKG